MEMQKHTFPYNWRLSEAKFERERYNKELEKRNSIIKELHSENKYLHKELKRHVTLLSKLKIKNDG